MKSTEYLRAETRPSAPGESALSIDADDPGFTVDMKLLGVSKQPDGELSRSEGSSEPLRGSQSDTNASSASSSETSSLDKVQARESWTGKLDFLMSCIGFAVGLGNIWRFPYLCYKNGGGAFLIPYFICLVAGGLPIFFLEISLGQFMQTGPIGAWNVCPIMEGIGYATTVITFLLNIYYIIILAWSLYYLWMSFSVSLLPWAHCENSWNTAKCFYPRVVQTAANATVACSRGGAGNQTLDDCVDPVMEFWEKKVLRITGGIDQVGDLVWELAICLLIIWILVFFCLFKGLKVTGKVVYFTATFPYIVITILLIRGVTLPGAGDGIEFYLKPNLTKLAEAQVWVDAGTQIFFSYAIALGAMIALGSYNNFYNNCYKDCIIVASINSATSLYGGVAIFSILGFMAKERGVAVSEVAEKGPGLAFIAYPKAIALMPSLPQLWSVLFFVMIITLGLGSQIVGVEAFLTAIIDKFPRQLRHRRPYITLAVVTVSYLLGLTMVTQGGMYVFQLFDYYAASGMSLLWVCFFEAVTVAWFYGAKRFSDNLEVMLGFRISPWFSICWSYLTPAVTLGILIFSIVMFQPLTYNDYQYPTWALTIGQSMAFASMVCVPATAVIKVLLTPGTPLERIKTLIRPVLHNYQTPSKYRDRTTIVDHVDTCDPVRKD